MARDCLGCTALAILCFVLTTSCGHSPTAPTHPPPPPPPPPPPIAVQLTGTVRAYGGDPVPDADVTVSNTADGSNPQSAKSDSTGHYAFSVLTGPVTVSAQYPGVMIGDSSDRRHIVLTADTVQDLELMGSIVVNAGESADAELHVGPHNGVCQSLFESYSELQPCRAFIVKFDRAGTLSARLDWPGGSGLALAQRLYVVADIPGFGREACCHSGEILRLPTTGPGQFMLVVRLRDRRLAPVRFTLTTSLS